MTLSAANYPTYPMFDRRTRWLYVLLIGSIGLEFGLSLVLGVNIRTGPGALALYCLPLILGAWAARRIGINRLATAMEGLALLYSQAPALWVSTVLLAIPSGPFIDDWLIQADRWLGFDWVAYLHFSRPYLTPLRLAYRTFEWLPAVVIIGLAIEHKAERMWQFITAALVGLIITIAIFPFAPAASPIVTYHITDPALTGAAKFWPIMTALREGQVQDIGPEHLAGMVSIPSYHTVASVQIAWAAWGSRWLRWPVLVTCLAMAVAIPTIGDHYLIDMIAGAVLGIATLPLARRMVGTDRKSVTN